MQTDQPNQSQRKARADILWIVGFSLVFQWVFAARLEHPTYMDAYYYTTNGQRLAQGHGFTELLVWQFLDEPQGIPTASHTYWMPLPSMLAAAGYTFADTFAAAQTPFWILAGLLPLLSFAISRKVSGSLWQARTAALLTASGGLYLSFLGQPSTFAPFAWAGGLGLFAMALAERNSSSGRGSPRYGWLLAGLMAGLGHLTRADGALLLIVGLLTVIRLPRARIIGGAWLLTGYLLAMGGWFGRNWAALGRPLSVVGTQTIFLTTYDDLFAYGRSFGLSGFLEWGWPNILLSKLKGLSIAGQTFVAVSCFIFLTPFVLWAWFRLRRDARRWPWLRPMTWYTVLLFLTIAIVFTLPGGRGGLFHSSAALWPWFMALAPAGIGFAIDRTAQRLSHWQPERAKRIFAGLFVGVAFAVSVTVGLLRTPDGSEGRIYSEIGAMLPEASIVMVGNAPSFHYHTGLPAVSVPNEPVEGMLGAAHAFDVTYLILDQDRPQPLAALYNGEESNPDVEFIDEFDGHKLYELRIPDSGPAASGG